MTSPSFVLVVCAGALALGCSGAGTANAPDGSSAADVVTSDTPASDAGPSDAPGVDVPAADVRADVPATDAPVADVPLLDAQGSDAPAADAPSSDAMTSDVPGDRGSADVPPVPDACTRPSIERAPVNLACGIHAGGAACPTGYACTDHSGVVLQQLCNRACTADCDCAGGDRCGSFTDKAGTHRVCVGD